MSVYTLVELAESYPKKKENDILRMVGEGKLAAYIRYPGMVTTAPDVGLFMGFLPEYRGAITPDVAVDLITKGKAEVNTLLDLINHRAVHPVKSPEKEASERWIRRPDIKEFQQDEKLIETETIGVGKCHFTQEMLLDMAFSTDSITVSRSDLFFLAEEIDRLKVDFPEQPLPSKEKNIIEGQGRIAKFLGYKHYKSFETLKEKYDDDFFAYVHKNEKTGRWWAYEEDLQEFKDKFFLKKTPIK